MFHFGHIYDKVDSKGFQYCQICGKGKFVAVPPVTPHDHMWDMLGDIQQKCYVCGEIRSIPLPEHAHDWELIGEGNIQRSSDNAITGKFWNYSCKVCKTIKTEKFGV